MTARGYELDEGLRVVKERVRRLELTVARNKPASGVSVTPTAPATSTNLADLLVEIMALIAAADIEALDEGVSLTTALASLDFVGAGVTVTAVGGVVTITIPGFGSAVLDDLTDVLITSPATADRLRFDGSAWRNSALIWRPVTVFDPTTGNYLPLVDGSGNQIMVEA